MLARIEGEPINLRGHHLRASAAQLALPDSPYRKKIKKVSLDSLKAAGYGDDFSGDSAEFWTLLRDHPDLRVRLIDTLDHLCLNTGCPRKRPSCSSQEASREDVESIENLGLKPGDVYTVREISAAIKRKIESLTPGLKL